MSDLAITSVHPPEIQAMIDEIAVQDFRRAAFLKLSRTPPCIHCDRWGSWVDGDPPESFICSCPAGVRLLEQERQQRAWSAKSWIRWLGKLTEAAARPPLAWVRPPRPGEPGAALQTALRRLQRLGASAPWVDLFAAGWRSTKALEALRMRPFEGPPHEERIDRPCVNQRDPRRPYLIGRARWCAGEGAAGSFTGKADGLRRADEWGRVAGLWLDRAELEPKGPRS